MWSFTKKAVVAVWAAFLWLIGVIYSVTLLIHGIFGYRCPDIQPGETCSFHSPRGTVRVPYEELGRVSVFGIFLGAALLIGAAFCLWAAATYVWKEGSGWFRRRSKPPERHVGSG